MRKVTKSAYEIRCEQLKEIVAEFTDRGLISNGFFISGWAIKIRSILSLGVSQYHSNPDIVFLRCTDEQISEIHSIYCK